MRARAGLANTLWDLNRTEEASEHYREMLQLNPGDNQGIRYSLLTLLMNLDRFDEVDKLLEQYEGDWSSEWQYTSTLRAFQKEGDSEAARKALAEALEQNSHVPTFLTERKRIPNRLPNSVIMGGESEAASYAAAHLNDWRKTPGAVAWLKEYT